MFGCVVPRPALVVQVSANQYYPRLALLICDIPVALIHTHGDYHAIFTRLLQASLDAISTDKPPSFTLDGFDVTQGIYPPPKAHYDGIIITGSASSVCDDIDWINALIAYTANIITTKPHVKITGICFGHQIVARAMSGQCVHNDSWEVGMTRIGMTHLGQSLFGVETLVRPSSSLPPHTILTQPLLEHQPDAQRPRPRPSPRVPPPRLDLHLLHPGHGHIH